MADDVQVLLITQAEECSPGAGALCTQISEGSSAHRV